MKYIFIGYVAFGTWFPSWQMLPTQVFDNHEMCGRYMKEVHDSFEFSKKTNQEPYVVDWHMTCKHFWETDADYEEFLKTLRKNND